MATAARDRSDFAVSRIERFSKSLNARPGLLLASYSVITLVVTFALAIRKPTWYDEIFTLHLSDLGSISKLLSALRAGVDLQPPLSYLVTHVFFAAAGTSIFVSRIPEVLGFWLMGLFVYRYVSFRYTPLWGIAAALFPFVSSYYHFAVEARPYGTVLGASAAAMASWQSAASGVRRRISLVMLVLAILVIVCSHYFGLLVIIPLFIGELTRTIRRRKADWPVILSALLPFGAIVVFLPLIHAAIGFAGAHPWNPPSITNLFASYTDPVSEYSNLAKVSLGVAGLALLFVLAGSFLLAYSPGSSRPELARALPPLEESIAAVAFLLIPFAGYVTAVVKTNMYQPRYVVPILVGYTLLFGFAAAHLFGGRASCVLAVDGILLLGFLINGAAQFQKAPSPTEGCPVMPVAGPFANLPVAMPSSDDYVRCNFYASSALKSRMLFVADPVLSLHYLGSDIADKNLIGANDVLGMHVVRFPEFRNAHRQFLMKVNDGWFGWLGPHYLSLGAKIELLPNGFYLVTDVK